MSLAVSCRAMGMMSTSVQSSIVELMITNADWFFPDSAGEKVGGWF